MTWEFTLSLLTKLLLLWRVWLSSELRNTWTMSSIIRKSFLSEDIVMVFPDTLKSTNSTYAFLSFLLLLSTFLKVAGLLSLANICWICWRTLKLMLKLSNWILRDLRLPTSKSTRLLRLTEELTELTVELLLTRVLLATLKWSSLKLLRRSKKAKLNPPRPIK